MNKISVFFCVVLASATVDAQKCLQLEITAQVSRLVEAGPASAAYGKCKTKTNDEGQLVISDYGTDLDQYDSFISNTTSELTRASLTGSASVAIPTAQDGAAIKKMAEDVKSMTPEQQRAWAMQMAQQQHAGGSGIQDDAATAKLVMGTFDKAVNQMRAVDDEFSAKILSIEKTRDEQFAAVRRGDKTKCVGKNKTGLAPCACVNAIESAYWKQCVNIQNNCTNQKIAAMNIYLPRIKALSSSVDNAIAMLQHGDAVKSAALKRQLFSAQTSAFANTFLISGLCTEAIRKDGAAMYVNLLNADQKKYDLGCSTE